MVGWCLLLLLQFVQSVPICENTISYTLPLFHKNKNERALKYCNEFKSVYIQRGCTNCIATYDEESCVSTITQYFHNIRAESSEITSEYIDVCFNSDLTETESAKLLVFLKTFCWGMYGAKMFILEARSTDVNIKMIPNEYTYFMHYEDFMDLVKIPNLLVINCIADFTNKDSYQLEIKKMKSYSAIYNTSSAAHLASCDCHEVLALPYFVAYDVKSQKLDTNTKKWKIALNFACLKFSYKICQWSKKKLDHMTSDETLQSIKDIPYTQILTFFVKAINICKSTWFEIRDRRNWTFSEIMSTVSYNMNGDLDLLSELMVAKLIDLGLSVNSYKGLLKIVGDNNVPCIYNLIISVFLQKNETFKYLQEYSNFWTNHYYHFDEHMQQLITIASQSYGEQWCDVPEKIYREVMNIEVFYYQMTNVWDAKVLSSMLQAAILNETGLINTAEYLNLLGCFDLEIRQVDDSMKPTVQYDEKIEERITTFRTMVFERKLQFWRLSEDEFLSNKDSLLEMLTNTNAPVAIPDSLKAMLSEKKKTV